MRNYLLIIGCFFSFSVSFAQRLVLPSQLQFNQLNYNPAFSGIREGLNFSSTVRSQFQNREVVRYQGVSVDLPLKFYSMGLGLSAEQNKIGENSVTTVKLAYSYKIKVAKGILNFGLDAGLDQFSFDKERQNVRDLDDPTLFETRKVFVPTLGAGLFFQRRNLFVGLSTDQLMRSSLTLDSPSSESKTSANYFLVAGTNHKLSERIRFNPRIFLQKTTNINPIITANVQLTYRDKWWLGAGYRLKSEIIGLIGADFSQLIHGFALPLKLGLAFNSPINQGVTINNSWEIHLSYNYKKRPNAEKIKSKKRIISPITFY